MTNRKYPDLTLEQAVEVLEISHQATIKNWLKGGHFPGSYQDENGAWFFTAEGVLGVIQRTAEVRLENVVGDLSLWEVDEDVEPPLL